MDSAIIIANTRETLRIEVSQLLYIEASGNYSVFHFLDKDPQVIEKDKHPYKFDTQVTMQLGKIDEIINRLDRKSRASLVRIDRSIIINMDYLLKIDLSNHRLLMMDTEHNVYPVKVAEDKLAEFKKALDKRS